MKTFQRIKIILSNKFPKVYYITVQFSPPSHFVKYLNDFVLKQKCIKNKKTFIFETF